MARVLLLSNDQKVGTYADQRALVGEVDKEFQPDERSACLSPLGLRSQFGDVLCIAHARVLGLYRKADPILEDLASRGVPISIAGGPAVMYDTPEKQVEFHAAARAKTGKPSAKQKRNPGRPSLYAMPTDARQLEQLREAWAGPMHTDDVIELFKGQTGKKPSRPWLVAQLGERPPHPGRRRKRRSDAKS